MRAVGVEDSGLAPVPRGAVTAHAVQAAVSAYAVTSIAVVLMMSSEPLREVLLMLALDTIGVTLPTFMVVREQLDLRAVYRHHPRLKGMRSHRSNPFDLYLYTQGDNVIRCFTDQHGKTLAAVRRGDVIEIVKVNLTDESPRVEDHGVEIALTKRVSWALTLLGFPVVAPFWLVIIGGLNHFLGLGMGWPLIVIVAVCLAALSMPIPGRFMMARLIERELPQVRRMKEELDVPRVVAEGLAGKRVVTCYRVTESSWLAAVRERDVIRLVTVTNEEAQ